MAEAEQPQIDDLKRLLKRLEHAKPDSGDAPQPPPLPNGTAPANKAAETGHPSPAKDVAALSARFSPATAPVQVEGGQTKSSRPMLTWLAAGAATAAVAVAALAGLQPRLLSHSNEQQARTPSGREQPTTALPAKQQTTATGHETAAAPEPAPPAAIATAATSSTPRTSPAVVPAPAEVEAQPQAAPASSPPTSALAEAPKAVIPPPAPAETGTPSKVTNTGPIPESPALRAAAPGPGRDKYDSEARLDAYLERGQKHLDDGDLTAARSFFRRVAESGDPRGALAMGATYDANYSGDLGIRADNTLAGEWYRRAMELGSKDALDRLERLEK